ncbi:MAG: polysaccharide biosynthesis/export family protein [Pelagimonas sp.]|uniref:polysaccharide biosynthesis/export family protein n=1 Tax=Pelagimonas sp. TaxID=2073170 RepID=UPI003D6B155B
MHSSLKLIAVLVSVLLLSACSLPRGAAVQSEILDEKASENPTFQVVDVTRANIPGILTWPKSGWHGHYHWPNTSSGSQSSIIRTGDRLNVRVWDSQDNSLITNPGERFTEIKGVEVDANGSIFLPYVNKVGVRGLTSAGARSKIQQRLEPIVPSAQVQVSLQQGRDHSIDVVGGVTKPGSYPMPSRNYKVLNVLADAGGIPSELRNPRVRLLRGSQTYEISSDLLFEDGSKNALLQPRDTLIVEEDDKSFIAFGASGKEDLIYFPKDDLTTLEAVSLMGGLRDARADPQGVLVLREYDSDAISSSHPGPDLQQVVFTFNLTTADGLFAARKFPINPNDTVLVTESPVVKLRTVLDLFGAVVGVSSQTANLAN